MPSRSAFKRDRLYDHWWEPFNAIPPSATCDAYSRLRHLWVDPTRTRPEKFGRTHEFYYQARETHLTAVLWENFAALDAEDWLPRLATAAGLRQLPRRVTACKWSYGWVRERPKRKILDIVVHYRESEGSEGVLVIEAKNLGSGLGSSKDLDPTYYLDIPELLEFERRSQVYLVDAEVMDECRRAVAVGTHDVGFLSWQTLAGIQISSALALPVLEGLRHFVAGAIQRQYVDFGVRPDSLAAAYLADEPSRHLLGTMPPKLRQSSEERQRALWRLDPQPVNSPGRG